MTNGRIEIQPLPVGSIVAYTETLDAMTNGVLDSHHSGAPYALRQGAGARAASATSTAASRTRTRCRCGSSTAAGWSSRAISTSGSTSTTSSPVWWGVESVPAKKPLRTLADFKGVKMRVPEGLGADIWRRAGVGVVTLPGSEVYTALERGVIEATDWGTLGMNNDLGYHRIAKYPLHPGFHSMPAAEVAIAMPKWNALIARPQGDVRGRRARFRARHGAADRHGGHEGGGAGARRRASSW